MGVDHQRAHFCLAANCPVEVRILPLQQFCFVHWVNNQKYTAKLFRFFSCDWFDAKVNPQFVAEIADFFIAPFLPESQKGLLWRVLSDS